jgi:hypothetical protein
MARVMLRTTVMLPAGLKKRAMAVARQRKLSFAEFVRKALEQSTPGPRKQLRGKDPYWDHVPVYDGLPADLSVNHDKYLYDEEP